MLRGFKGIFFCLLRIINARVELCTYNILMGEKITCHSICDWTAKPSVESRKRVCSKACSMKEIRQKLKGKNIAEITM